MNDLSLAVGDAMPPNESAAGVRSFRWLWLAIALLLLITACRMALAFTRHGNLLNEAGVWSGLAIDYAHGTLYRPIISELGYGGTRYFPLYFMLHGELIKRGFGVLAAGYAATEVSLGLLLLGAFVLQRRLGVRAGPAAAMALLILCSMASQIAVTAIRGDLLPAALSVWGVVACAGVQDDRQRGIAHATLGTPQLILAAIFFGLAIFAKITSVAGLGAVVLFLLLHRRFGQAALLGFLSALVAGGLLLAVNIASHGRFWESLRACASGGGGMASIKNAPFRLMWVIMDRDAPAMVVLTLALGGLLLLPPRRWKDLPSLLLISTAICTAAIFLTPGIDRNHMTELHTAALVFLAVQITRGRERGIRASPGAPGEGPDVGSAESLNPHPNPPSEYRERGLNPHPPPPAEYRERGLDAATIQSALAATTLLACCWFALDLPAFSRDHMRDDYARAFRSAAPDGGPLLCDNPMGPVFVGQSPYILDEFMFGVIGRKDPALRKDFYDKMRSGYFAAIIFTRDPDAPENEPMVGKEFPQLLKEHYEEVDDLRFNVYRRKRYRSEVRGQEKSGWICIS